MSMAGSHKRASWTFSSAAASKLAPSTKDTLPRSRVLQLCHTSTVQLTTVQFDEQLKDPEWKKRKQNRLRSKPALFDNEPKTDGQKGTCSQLESKLFCHVLLDHPFEDVEVCNNEASSRKNDTLSLEDGIQLFSSSFDDSECTQVLSDDDDDGTFGCIFVAEKTVLSSPSRFSLMDKTLTMSDESSQSDEEKESVLSHDTNSVVKSENRPRRLIMAMSCCVSIMIMFISILVVFVGDTNAFRKRGTNTSAIKKPTSVPSIQPSTSNIPSMQPTSYPTLTPTKSPFILFTYGESLYTDHELGIQISVGLTAKRIAKSKTNVNYANGEHSSTHYHSMMDGAGISLLPDGGYVYLSNAEVENNGGGVYGLYFNKDREIIDYKTLLTGTSRNCGGGMSPWNTWISCEEVGSGQCWQVEPNPGSPNHNSPNVTLLGGSNGGAYESVAVDNTNKNNPIFFVTEDKGNGELRRFEADGNGWDALHEGGQTTYLEFLDGNRFQWTSNLADGKSSAANHYPNAEGIIYHNSTLYFVAKVSRRLFILDLEAMTYTSERTGSSWVGQGSFNSQPDQIIESDLDTRKFIYFTEDGGNSPGVHVRDREGNYYTMVRGIPGGRYKGDETVGIAFSPDRRAFYFGFQDAGVLMEVTRDDGHTFN